MPSSPRRIPITLAVTLVLATLVGAHVATAGGILAEHRITTSVLDRGYLGPDISGSVIVYYTSEYGNADVFAYNVGTATTRKLSPDTGYQRYPSISGGQVVWQDERAGNSDIYLYDLASSTERRLTSGAANERYPAISGDKVVWQDDRAGNADIYLLDLATGVERLLTPNGADQKHPAIDGRYVVWEDYRNGNADVYVYDLTTATETRLTTGASAQQLPDVSGQHVVFEDASYGSLDVYEYDLALRRSRRLSDGLKQQQAPAISGDWVVWCDTTNDIYACDLRTGNARQMTAGSSGQRAPAIDGTRVAWEDYRNINSDIYQSELQPPSITLSGPATVGFSAPALLTGALKSNAGTPVPNAPVTLQTLGGSGEWSDAGTAWTGEGGTFEWWTPALSSRTQYRAVFAGTEILLPCTSPIVSVLPQAQLSVPVGPTRYSHLKTFRATGTLLPLHAGTPPIKLYCYRLESKKWVLRRTLTGSTAPGAGKSTYAVSVRLPYVGTWRYRAYFIDADHAGTYSGWKTTVIY